jgi:hypothetical protein
MAPFWNQLVREEKSHAMVITMLRDVIGKKKLLLDTHRFKTVAVENAIAFIEQQTDRVAAEGTTPLKALSLAIDIEKAMIERDFFTVFDSDTPMIRKEFSDLREHTMKHQKMLERMLNIEKENNKAEVHAQVSTKVKASQEDKLKSLSSLEDTIGNLYDTFAVLFPEKSEFWSAIANEERKHAKLLLSMCGLIKDGYVFYHLDHMKTEAIESYLTLAQEKLQAAKEGQISQSEAVAMALSIESSIVEAKFYEDVKSDAPEFKIIAERLASDTAKHIAQIETQL